MKIIRLLTLGFVCAISVVACGGSSSSSGKEQPADNTQPKENWNEGNWNEINWQ